MVHDKYDKTSNCSPSRIIFAASFETSEPEIFIAMPRSAFFKAGESLTPSPVLKKAKVRT